MKIYRSLAIFALGFVTVVGPAATDQNVKIRTVIEKVRDDPSRSEAALEFLKAIAEGRPEFAASSLGVSFGFAETDLRSGNYEDLAARAAAYRAMGELGTPAAIAYLEGLSVDDFAPEEVFELWSTASVAAHKFRLGEISSIPEKARFLERLLTSEESDVAVRGRLAEWALEELCDNGPLTSLPAAQALIYEWEVNRAQERSEFCELRMKAAVSHPDRITALGSVLQVTDKLPDPRLTSWAIERLSEMEDPAAIQPLERYEQEILDLPQSSPQRATLLYYANVIRSLNSSRMSAARNDPSRGYVIQ